MAASSGVDAVDDLGGNVHGGVEAKGHVGAVNVVVNGLGQANNVQALLAQQVGGFVGAVAAQAKQTIQLGGAVVLLHGGYLVHLVFLDLIAHAVVQRLGYTADGGVQARAVAAGSQDANTNRHKKTSLIDILL